MGNLLALIGLIRFTLHGHKTIVLVKCTAFFQSYRASTDGAVLKLQLGGGTGAVGDPSGRSSERTSLSRNKVDSNLDSIHKQVQMLLDSALSHAQKRLTQNPGT